MNNSKMSRVFSLIAGMCFAAYGIYRVWEFYTYIYAIRFWRYSISSVVVDVALCFVYLAFAVLLFIGKKNIGFLIPTGAAIFVRGYYLLHYFNNRFLLEFVLLIVLLVVLMMNVIPPMEKPTGITKVLCYVYIVYSIVLIIYTLNLGRRSLYPITLGLVIAIVERVGYLFIGLWLRQTVGIPQKAIQQNAYAAMNPHAAALSQDDADKLKIYKDLLDSGAITQEEFDAKKKQILGL